MITWPTFKSAVSIEIAEIHYLQHHRSVYDPLKRHVWWQVCISADVNKKCQML